jgi:hypothetical protein
MGHAVPYQPQLGHISAFSESTTHKSERQPPKTEKSLTC